ncbi:MAG: hypothetical protein ACYS8X_06900 [Planctomycetota bacterium]|jgi:hypothetical protein
MEGSRTIRIIKRDGSLEKFDAAKLAGAMWSAMDGREGSYSDAIHLADALGVYLKRVECYVIASAAVLDMTLKIMRKVQLTQSAKAMEVVDQLRSQRRECLRVVHETGQVTVWDKSWLADVAQKGWHLQPRTARLLAGEVERDLIRQSKSTLARHEVIDQLNARVLACGLADAVPVPR